MSGLATFSTVPDGSEAGWANWAFAHMADHTDIARVVFQVAGRRLDLFPLNPIDFQDRTWVYNHVVMHQQMDAVLGIAGFDLTSVDWEDPQSLVRFVEFNYIEHESANQILRL